MSQPTDPPLVGEDWYWLPGVELPDGTVEQQRAWLLASPQPREVMVVDVSGGDVTYYWKGGYVPFNVAHQKVEPYPLTDIGAWMPIQRPLFWQLSLEQFIDNFRRL